MNLIAVDPGKVAGVAMLNSLGHFQSVEAPWPEAMDTIDGFLAVSRGIQVAMAVESFHITARTHRLTAQLDAPYMIGACMWAAHLRNCAFMLQAPAERLIAKKAFLKSRDWWFPTKDNHRNDAAAHLVVLALRYKVIHAPELLEEQ